MMHRKNVVRHRQTPVGRVMLENEDGRIVKIARIHQGMVNVSYFVHFWNNKDHTAYRVAGEYPSFMSAREGLGVIIN